MSIDQLLRVCKLYIYYILQETQLEQRYDFSKINNAEVQINNVNTQILEKKVPGDIKIFDFDQIQLLMPARFVSDLNALKEEKTLCYRI